MSVRAHQIRRVELFHPQDTSFNFWQDSEFLEALNESTGFMKSLNDDNCGICEFSREQWDEFLEEISHDEMLKWKDIIVSIEEDFERAIVTEHPSWVMYNCY